MSYVIDLDPIHRALRITVTSTVLTDEELKDMHRSIACFASQGGPYAAIGDLSQVVHMPVSANTIRALAQSAPAIPGHRRRVLVASQPITYGLARMFELIRNEMDEEIEVLRSMDEAYAALGLTSDDFSQRLFPERSAA